MSARAIAMEAWGTVGRRDARATAFAVVLSLVAATLILYFRSAEAALVMSCVALLVVAVWEWPIAGFYLLLGLTLLLEQYHFADFTPVTRTVPFFENLGNVTALKGVPLNSLEILLVLVSVAVVAKTLTSREARAWRQNALALPVVAFMSCLGLWLAFGVANGGSLSIGVWELRAFAYLGVVVMLLPQLITSAARLNAVIWIVALAVGVKAAQGIWNYAVVLQGDLSRVRAVTAHEDALFMAVMLVLLLALWILDRPSRLRTVLTALAPVMAFAFVATNRRAAYVALAVGVALLFLVLATMKRHRRLIAVVALSVVLASASYALAFWTDAGPLGKPVRAVRSMWSPQTAADVSSNYYRQAEEYGLMATIRQSPVLGLGFGRQYLGSGKLSSIGFSLRDYIPHNEILWIWAKMGTLGFWVFWMFIAHLIVRGLTVFRTARHPRYRALAATAVVLVVMQLVVSYADLQLTFYRNMVFLGVFLGVLAAVPSLEEGGPHAVAD